MYMLQNEFDNEPSFIVKTDDPDASLITIEPGNLELAQRILKFLNADTAATTAPTGAAK